LSLHCWGGYGIVSGGSKSGGGHDSLIDLWVI